MSFRPFLPWKRSRALASLALFLVLALVLAAAGGSAQRSTSIEVPLADQVPDLAKLSEWRQVLEHRGGAVEKSKRGVFPVGDGEVFGYLGLGDRACAVQALTGPHYQTDQERAPEGHFGEQSFGLRLGGKDVALPRQKVARVRGANFVVTEDRSDDGLVLVTLNFALRGHKTLFRVVDVRNETGKPVDGLELVATMQGPVTADGAALRKSYPSERRPFAALARFAGEAKAEGEKLVKALGKLEAGDVARTAFVVHTFRRGDKEPDAAKYTAEEIEKLAPVALKWWKDKLANTATLECNHKKLTDLIEDWKILMSVQRSEPSGAVSPMVNFRGSWVRDNNGPMLAFLRYNMWDDAKAILEYTFNATRLLGALPNSVPLDLDFAPLATKETNWSEVKIPDAELGSWVILQHAWYWRSTQDLQLIKRHLPLLQRCLNGQTFSRENLQTFHGDETYLHGSFYSLFPDRVPAPNYLIADDSGRRPYSLDSGVIYLCATYAMGELLETIDKTDRPGSEGSAKTEYTKKTFELAQNIEKHFWMGAPEKAERKENRFAPALSPINLAPHSAPFADINLRLQWAGWTFASGEKNKQNVRNTLGSLWRSGKSARVGMTPTVGHTTGHTQGYLLYALADLDDRSRLDALEEILRMAEPAGEWGEIHDEEGRPIPSYDRNWPNRLRPWESGVNVDAILFALNGIRYATVAGWDTGDDARVELRIPKGANWLTFRNIKHDARHLNIFLEERHEKMTPDEIAEQDKKRRTGELKPEDFVDPNVPVHRMAFRIYLENQLPKDKYITCAINVGGTVYVRYLLKDQPVNEKDRWPVDKEEFLPPARAPGNGGAGLAAGFTPAPPQPPQAGYDTLIVAARPGIEGRVSGVKPMILDIGLPILPEHVADLLMQQDDKGAKKRRCDRVIYDVGARDAGRLTFKTSEFWNDGKILGALNAFREDKGSVHYPVFVRRWQVAGPFPRAGEDPLAAEQPPDNEANWPGRGGAVAWKELSSQTDFVDLAASLPHQGPAVLYAAAEVESPSSQEVLLKVGSDDGVRVTLNGKVQLSNLVSRGATPDQDEALVPLAQGVNRILVKVENRGGGSGFFLRFVDKMGVPVENLVVKRMR